MSDRIPTQSVEPPVNNSSTSIMDPFKNEEQIIKNAIGLLSSLISPPAEENETSREEVKEFDGVLRTKLSSVINSEVFECFTKTGHLEKTGENSPIHTRWDFVRMCLRLMKIIWDVISQTEDEKKKLLSVAEKKVLEKAFQFIVALAVLPYLLPGVGVPLEKKCLHFKDVKPEDLDDLTIYKRLSFTIDSLLDLRSVDVFHEIIISKHLDVIIAVLMQLSFAPYRKPVTRDVSEAMTNMSMESLAENCDFGQMSFSMWNGVEKYRKKYRDELEKLQTQLYPPLVIRNFFILLSSQGLPRWMYVKLTNIITKQILKEDGVMAAITGILDVDNESPFFSSHCMTVSKLIGAIFCHQNESKMRLFALQLEKVLSKDKMASNDNVYINVMVSAVAEMMKKDQKHTQEYLLNAILNPLRDIICYSGEQIGNAIVQMYNLCVTPWNKTVALPISVIEPVSLVLCFVCAHIKDSVCYLKTPVKDLLVRFLQEADEDGLSRFFDRAVFHEQMSQGIAPIPVGRKIVLSPDGGITVVEGEAKFSEMENGMMLFQLMKGLENYENHISFTFIYLLKKYVHFSADKKFDEQRMIVAFLLVQLSQDSEALKCMLKNSENIISFVRDLLSIHRVEDDENTEVIRICLVFLTMALCDVRKKKDVNWKIFASLTPSLDELKNSKLPEIAFLAEEVRNRIATRNVIGGVASGAGMFESKHLIEEMVPSAFEKAIEDACDPLLPVRAHALMELIDLLKKGDKETLAKKDEIFLLFKENLKDEESYLYLRAIEGLACLALLIPDKVLPLLCQGFLGFSESSRVETRLKIGEILMRTVRLMNDFIVPRKNLLINTFVNGAKDEDSVMRASSLSNLSELCLTLRWNIRDVLFEIIECAQQALRDQCKETRRAAVLLIGSLFRGMEKDTFEVRRCLELYKELKNIRSNEEDEVMRVQAQLALDSLNEIMKGLFAEKPAMEKKIYVLDCPK